MTRMWKEILEQPQALKSTIINNITVVNDLVLAIKKRNIRNIVIAARGTSDHAAVYGKYVFELLLGIPVALAASSVFTLYGGDLNMQDSLVIGISQSGKAADVYEVIQSARRSNAITVAITNNSSSEMAAESDFSLDCASGEEISVAATKTFSAQIMLLAYLAAECSGNTSLTEELKILPEILPQVFNEEKVIDSTIGRYRFMNECFVLSRGINYSISLEAALKIQETAYVRAKAFATSDFQHGPIAMIKNDIPVVIIAPRGPSFKDVSSMAEKLHREQIDTLIVSNDNNLLRQASVGYKIPETENDIISPFYNAAIAQMFACKLSLLKGLDPDNPKGLNKITITK